MGVFIDILAALVPAEVLAAHAAILSFTSKGGLDSDGNPITVITNPETLHWTFFVLLGSSVVLYLLAHPPMKKLRDWLRLPIPPLAFLVWTLLQKPSAADVIWPNFQLPDRFAAAVLAAILLAGATKALAD
jgi:hypothetical protein